MSKLLLVTNDSWQKEQMVAAAEAVGFSKSEMVEASSEKDAYGAIDGARFSVAVVDIMLSTPEEKEEGLRVIAKLHERQPDCRIIGLTQAIGDQGVRALKAGAHDFIYTKWKQINWVVLLRERLKLWKEFAE